ncbi:hypothetical protein EYF80_015227 [Liparis tanakae]|uniref:Uncharacterized protein n=1 Tax=Liparis tanakae TaxID=230148 RepID=A0A4Z2I8Y2_9TELE|nr:hypothetical protein EYF80_015227 [Liparis tanakae]
MNNSRLQPAACCAVRPRASAGAAVSPEAQLSEVRGRPKLCTPVMGRPTRTRKDTSMGKGREKGSDE